MATDAKWVYDGFASLLGGMNAGVAPSLVAGGQCSNAVNVAFRGGKPRSRSRFVYQACEFAPVIAADETETLSAEAVESAFLTGRYQGAAEYRYRDEAWLFVCISGRLYRLTPQVNGFLVEDMTPDAGNNPNLEMAYFCQSHDILVVQDGESPPILVKGNAVYRQDFAHYPNGVPIGTIMAYGYGRLCVAHGNSYVFSDLLGEEPDATVKFNDNTYLAENSSFDLPPSFGKVTAMHFINQQDTATGQGPLIVFGENGAESVNITRPRPEWQKTQIQVEALTHIGALGHRAVVAVNGDLWFHSADGWRSYRQARAEQGGANQVPQSTRVRPYTERELPEQLQFGSAIFINNRLIVTCNPQRSARGCVHAGLLALDFDVLTIGFTGGDAAPAWDGYWQGLRVAELLTMTFKGRKRAFAFHSEFFFNDDGSSRNDNGLYEIVEGYGMDNFRRNSDHATPVLALIASSLETAALSCEPTLGSNAYWTEKRLEFCEVFEQSRLGATQIAVEYRQDGNAGYKALASFSENAPSELVFGPGDSIYQPPPIYTVRNRSFTAADTATPPDKRIDRRFYECQCRLSWSGTLEIHRFRIGAVVLPDSRRAGP